MSDAPATTTQTGELLADEPKWWREVCPCEDCGRYRAAEQRGEKGTAKT
jgi:hypothetical protein